MRGKIFCDEPADPYPVALQACVLAPDLFGMFFSHLYCMLLIRPLTAFMLTTSDGNLFNLACLHSESSVTKVYIREMLFADEADQFADEYKQFCLSLKETNVSVQDDEAVENF